MFTFDDVDSEIIEIVQANTQAKLLLRCMAFGYEKPYKFWSFRWFKSSKKLPGNINVTLSFLLSKTNYVVGLVCKAFNRDCIFMSHWF